MCRYAADVKALYDGFDTVGLQYGPGYRTLVHTWSGGSTAAARLRARSPTHERWLVYPADVDDALCIGTLTISRGGDGETRLPFAADEAWLQGTVGELWAVRHALLNASLVVPY